MKGISLIDLQSLGRHANLEKNRTVQTKHSCRGQLAGIEVELLLLGRLASSLVFIRNQFIFVSNEYVYERICMRSLKISILGDPLFVLKHIIEYRNEMGPNGIEYIKRIHVTHPYYRQWRLNPKATQKYVMTNEQGY